MRAGAIDQGMRFRPFDEFGVFPKILDISVDHTRDGLYHKFAMDLRNPFSGSIT